MLEQSVVKRQQKGVEFLVKWKDWSKKIGEHYYATLMDTGLWVSSIIIWRRVGI